MAQDMVSDGVWEKYKAYENVFYKHKEEQTWLGVMGNEHRMNFERKEDCVREG